MTARRGDGRPAGRRSGPAAKCGAGALLVACSGRASWSRARSTRGRAARSPTLTHPVAMIGAMEPATTTRFALAARVLAQAARGLGLRAPSFRSPPRLVGADRTLLTRAGRPTVAVRVRGRAWVPVLSDMVEGVVAANGLVGPPADRAAGRAVAGRRARAGRRGAAPAPSRGGWRDRAAERPSGGVERVVHRRRARQATLEGCRAERASTRGAGERAAAVAGPPVPARRHVRRRGHELRHLLGGRGGGRAVPVRRPHGGAGPPHGADRALLPRLPARRPAGPALRLPGPRAVGSGPRRARQPRQAPARPVRQGHRRDDASGIRRSTPTRPTTR